MNIKKSSTKVLALVIGLTLMATIAIWQFYLFATFQNAQGIVDVQGGALHLWLAIGAILLACLVGFALFSVSLRRDNDEVIHITP